jgi:hypothetical protein
MNDISPSFWGSCDGDTKSKSGLGRMVQFQSSRDSAKASLGGIPMRLADLKIKTRTHNLWQVKVAIMHICISFHINYAFARSDIVNRCAFGMDSESSTQPSSTECPNTATAFKA